MRTRVAVKETTVPSVPVLVACTRSPATRAVPSVSLRVVVVEALAIVFSRRLVRLPDNTNITHLTQLTQAGWAKLWHRPLWVIATRAYLTARAATAAPQP